MVINSSSRLLHTVSLQLSLLVIESKLFLLKMNDDHTWCFAGKILYYKLPNSIFLKGRILQKHKTLTSVFSGVYETLIISLLWVLSVRFMHRHVSFCSGGAQLHTTMPLLLLGTGSGQAAAPHPTVSAEIWGWHIPPCTPPMGLCIQKTGNFVGTVCSTSLLILHGSEKNSEF